MQSMIWNLEYKDKDENAKKDNEKKEKDKDKEDEKEKENEQTGQCLYSQVVAIAKAEGRKQSNELNREINLLIDMNPQSWKKLSNLIYINNKSKYAGVTRQDRIKNGLKMPPDMKYKELKRVSLKAKQFYPIRISDYQVYLSELLVRAHGINEFFQECVRGMIGKYIEKNKHCFRSGPVKAWARSVAKAQFDYSLGYDTIFPVLCFIFW